MSVEALKFVSGLAEILHEIGKENGLSDCKIKNTSGWQKGDGYMGFITLSKITGKTENDEESALNLVIKTSSKNDELRSATPLAKAYRQEVYFYEVIAPSFSKFLEEKKLPAALNIPKCYKTSLIEKSEYLIFENMKELNYKVWNRSLPMDEGHIEMVLKEFGRLHAISYAMRDQRPLDFKNLTEDLREIFYDFVLEADIITMINNFVLKSEKCFDPVLHENELKQFQIFKIKMENFLKRLPDCVDEHSVIIHGDGWTNNMLFEYGDADNSSKPTNICLIDFQLTRFTSPIIDLGYFLFACSPKSAITNLDDFLDFYYTSLSENLQKMGSDVDKLFPYSVFREHWKKYAIFGVTTAMMLLYVMLSDVEESVDLTSATEAGQNFAEAFDYDIADMDEFLDRVRHILLYSFSNQLI